MSLSAADVAEIMRLVEQSTFDELTLEIDGMKLTLRRGAAVAQGAPGQGAFGQSAVGQGAFGQGASGQGAMAGNSAGGNATAGNPAVSGARAAQPATSHNEASAPSAALANTSKAATPDSAATRAGAGHGDQSARASSASDANVHDVQSPLLGTFYRSPKPGAPPFVDVGSVVDEDTTVAIIEVMKLMNTVRAGVRGTVTEVLASDGALVEFEQPLLRVRKAG